MAAIAEAFALISVGSNLATIMGKALKDLIGQKVADNNGNNTKEMVSDILNSFKNESELILEALQSIQESKRESAQQAIRCALDDFQLWMKSETPSSGLIVSITLNAATVAAAKSGHINNLSIDSMYYLKRAINQLEKAYDLARDVFNDKVNCSPKIRMEALEIRLFCVTLIYWRDPKCWPKKWQRELEFFFEEKHLAQLAFTTKVVFFQGTNNTINAIQEIIDRIYRSLSSILVKLTLSDAAFSDQAHNFTIFLTKKTLALLNGRGIHYESVLFNGRGCQQIKPATPTIEDFPEVSVLLTTPVTPDDGKPLKCTHFSSINEIVSGESAGLTHFRCLCEVRCGNDTEYWAIDQKSRLVHFKANSPPLTLKILDNGRRGWFKVIYDEGKIRAYRDSKSDMEEVMYSPVTKTVIQRAPYVGNLQYNLPVLSARASDGLVLYDVNGQKYDIVELDKKWKICFWHLAINENPQQERRNDRVLIHRYNGQKDQFFGYGDFFIKLWRFA